jgi:hypothetical protein
MISAVQLTRPGAVPAHAAVSLVEALVQETESLAAPQDFRSIVSTDRLKKFGLMAVTVSVLGLGAILYGHSVCIDLLRRAFLDTIPVPRKTRVLVANGDKIIGRGDSVRLEAFADGIVPADGKVEIRYRNRRPQELALEQNRDNEAHFGKTIDNVQDSFAYVVHLNDGSSPAHTVTAIPRPTVATIECTQVYPAYAGLPPVQRPLGDLTLLAGSRLHLAIRATKDLTAGRLRLVGPEQYLPLEIAATNAAALHGSFRVPPKGMSGFAVELLDTEGMESRDAAVYRVEILPDKPPAVRILSPERKEELVTREAVLPIGMAIEDDHAIAGIRLHYKVDSVKDGEETVVPLDLEGGSPQKLRRTYLWHIGAIFPQLAEGSLVEFWVSAVDNNDATGPGVGTSDHQLARVVSADEKRTELLNRASDYLGGIDDVAQDQEKANRNLGTIIHEVILESVPQ